MFYLFCLNNSDELYYWNFEIHYLSYEPVFLLLPYDCLCISLIQPCFDTQALKQTNHVPNSQLLT